MEEEIIKVEIYWKDLTERKREELLSIFGDNGNWDIIPIAVIEIEKEN